MKQAALVMVGWLLLGGVWTKAACADEAVVNNAPATLTKVESVVNALGPGFDEYYNIRDGSWGEGVSAALWNFQSKSYHLASWRLGYGHQDQLAYTSLRLDLPGLSHRFVPEVVRGVATTGYLSALWTAVGKYGSVGPLFGYSWRDAAVAYGFTLGGQISF